MDKELIEKINELEKRVNKIDERTYKTWQRLCELFKEIKEMQLDMRVFYKRLYNSIPRSGDGF